MLEWLIDGGILIIDKEGNFLIKYVVEGLKFEELIDEEFIGSNFVKVNDLVCMYLKEIGVVFFLMNEEEKELVVVVVEGDLMVK